MTNGELSLCRMLVPPMLDHGWWVVLGYEPFDQSMRLPREQEPAVDAATPSTDSALKALKETELNHMLTHHHKLSIIALPKNMTNSCDL